MELGMPLASLLGPSGVMPVREPLLQMKTRRQRLASYTGYEGCRHGETRGLALSVIHLWEVLSNWWNLKLAEGEGTGRTAARS